MRDICTEALVPVIPTAGAKLGKLFLIAQVIVSVILVILFGLIGIVILGVSLWLLSRQLRKTDAEYEYVHTNDVFDVDLVIRNSSRRQLCSIDLGTVVLVAPVGSEELAALGEIPETDYTGNQTDNLYAMVWAKDGQRRKLILKLEEPMRKSLGLWLPGKVK